MPKKIDPDFERAAKLAAQPDFVTGYQYSPETNRFIGEYQIHNNKDKEEVHLPPFTTLTPPPAEKAGKSAFWTGTGWELRDYEGIKIFNPEEVDSPRQIKVPVFKRARKEKPGSPGEMEDVVEIVQELTTVEDAQAKAASVRDLFEAQQRAWGLRK